MWLLAKRPVLRGLRAKGKKQSDGTDRLMKEGGTSLTSSLSRRALLGWTASAASAAIAAAMAPTGRSAAAPADLRISNAPSVARTFFVSSSGSDDADGMTLESAWATIQKANSSLPVDSSVLLFRRGDTFYGELNLPFGCEVGSYGSGARPILTMYKQLNAPQGWDEHADGVWKIDLGSPDTHGGYTATNDANVGFLVVEGVVKPALKFALSDLDAPWDFYCDIPNDTLYVRSSGNPATIASDINAAPKGNAYGATGAVIHCAKGGNDIHDVHVTGTGGCGIRGNGSDVHIHDCLIDYIGGSWLAGQPVDNTRYGNAIENWPNVSRWTVEKNEIAQVYDVAWSPQGRDQNGGPVFWEDMTIRDNYIHDCGQMFEIWSQNSNAESPGFVRILIENNVCERAGYGVFSDVRPDQDVRVHLLSYRLQTPVDVTIQNNTFDDAYSAYSYHAEGPPSGYVTRNNTIRLKAGTKMQFQRPETVEQAADWQAATGRESGSTITVLP